MIRLMTQYPGILAYCFLTVCFSGPGQTYVISFFIPYLAQEFELRAGQLGTLYGVATVCGAFLLPYFGRLLDRLSLSLYTWIAVIFSVLGFAVLSLNHYVGLIFLSFLLIRVSGQGLFAFAGRTTASREFGKHRGKALAIAGLGNLPAEMILPIVVALIAEHWGWRWSSGSLGAMILLIYLPSALFLLKRHNKLEKLRMTVEFGNHFSSAVTRQINRSIDQPAEEKESDRTLSVDLRLYMMLFCNMALPFVLTGFFYYQVQLAELKNWSIAWVAGSFAVFGIFRAVFAMIAGSLIDRFSARALYPAQVLPLILALLVLYFVDHRLGAVVYLGLSGIAVGIGATVNLALWAEMYGTQRLGAIQGLGSGFGVAATALAPPVFGWLFDFGVSLSSVLIYSMGIAFLCGVSGVVATRTKWGRASAALE